MTKARSLADFISDGNPLADGTIAVSEVSGAAPLASPSFTGNIAVTGNVDGRDVAADGTKLDGIETSATADQTDAEIRTAVEAATDSNVFTDADHSKLNAIEASATADQSNAEIRTAVEAATDSNVFTDADHTKLNAIEASADVTDTVNVVAALTAGSNITIAANGTIAGAAQYTHPTHAGDDAAIDTGALSGATVISDLDLNITTDTLGHVTDANATVATRNLTLANLGYTGATDATNNTVANAALPKAGGAVTGNVTFGDSNKLVMGAGSDLLVFHDTSNSYIQDVGSGNLIIAGNADIQITDSAVSENKAVFTTNGAVTLYYDNASKFATTSSGIDVTGTVNADALTGIGSIDATTAAAIGNAGIGGDENFVLLSTTTVTSNVTTIDVSLPTGYKKHFLEWRGILHTYASNNRNANFGFTDSSGSMASAFNAGASVYRGATEGSGGQDMLLLSGPQFTAGGAANTAEGLGPYWYLDITNARSSSDTTMIYWRAAGPYNRYGGTGATATGSYGNGQVVKPEDNPKIRFGSNGSQFHSQSGNILLWGVK